MMCVRKGIIVDEFIRVKLKSYYLIQSSLIDTLTS